MADGSCSERIDAVAIAKALRISKRGAIKRAAKEEWAFEEERAKGGLRRVYEMAALPDDVQRAVRNYRAITAASNRPQTALAAEGQQLARGVRIREAVDAAVLQRQREHGQAAAAALTGAARERMEAKVDLLNRLTSFAAERGVKKCAAMDEFCDAYSSGALDVPQAARRHVGEDLHPATLRRWRRVLKTQGPAALAGAYGNRKGEGRIEANKPLHDFVIGVLCEKPNISVRLMHDAIAARLPQVNLSRRTLAHFLARWKRDNAELFTAVTNPDAWKSRYMPAFGSYSQGITRMNQLWMLDSTPADLQLQDGRYSLIGVVDVATRQMRLHVSRTSTADAVCQLLRRTMLEWGVPDTVKMDNGRDYASERVASLLLSLHVEARFSTPFSPWEKPHIERAFRTFSHHLLTLLPGYSGHNVAEAQAIRARQSFADQLLKKNAVVDVRMTAQELQLFCDQWTRELYAHEPHRGEGMDGMSPFQKMATLRDTVKVVGDVRALDLLLGAGTLCTVQKKGLRLDKLTYVAPELASVMRQKVLVRRDEADLGRVVVYHNDAFLCVAECPEVTGVSLQEIALETRARKVAGLQELKRQAKALGRKSDTASIARDILQHEANKNATLAALPLPNVVHITPQLEAASAAADGLARAERGAGRPSEAEIMDSMLMVVREEQSAQTDAEGRFKQALDVMLIPDSERDDLQRIRLRNYMESAEFTSRWDIFDEFGARIFSLDEKYNALLPADAFFHKKGG